MELPEWAWEPQILEKIARDKADGYEIWFASAGVREMIAPIAQKMEVQFVSSQLDFRPKCTGRLVRDLLQTKKEAVLKITAGRPYNMVSDNPEDVTLLQMAEKGIAVARKKKWQQFWEKKGIPVIFIRP